MASRMCTKLINNSLNMRPNLNNLSGEKEALSLLELNTRIRGALSRAFPETCWVRAEMSDVRVNTSSGHCYLEFMEKNVQTGQLVAKVRGSIWAYVETLFRDGDRSDVRFRLESVGEGVC